MAVVDLPEPPFSLPITSRWARPSVRGACVWAMLGLGAGWKCPLIDFSSPASLGRCPRSGRRGHEQRDEADDPSGAARHLPTPWGGKFAACSRRFADPDGGVVEHRTAVRPAGISRGQRIDAHAGLEVAVGPDAFDHDDALLLAGLGLAPHDGLAALVADLEPLALDGAQRRAILGVYHHRRPHLTLLAARRLGEGRVQEGARRRRDHAERLAGRGLVYDVEMVGQLGHVLAARTVARPVGLEAELLVGP